MLTARPVRRRPARTGRALPAIAAGLGAGVTVGIVARAWMRFVSDDPEFSWSGTIAIVMLFAIAGVTQGFALGVRRRGWPRWAQTPVRVLAILGGLLLGQGAGAVMLPALVGGSLAVGRTDWPRWARVTAASVAGLDSVGLLLLLGGGLPVWRQLAGWVAMLALYGVIVAGLSLNLRPLDDGWHLRRRRWISTALAVAIVLVALHGFLVVGI